MRISMPYGADSIAEASLEGIRLLDTLDVKAVSPLSSPGKTLLDALENPIGIHHSALENFRPGDRVSIVVSDAFRKTGVEHFLPQLLQALADKGISNRDIRFLIATGSHRAPDNAETAQILGQEIFDQFKNRIYAHDPRDRENLVFLGTTSRGTPVHVNRRIQESDRVILTGTVVFHYFGGFGGGRKSLTPGLAGIETIAHNHALNLDPESDRLNPAVRIGALEGNPVAEDMLESARMCRCDFIINTVLNRDGAIAGLFAGELDQAHREAARFAAEIYGIDIPEKADIVIASAGAVKNFLQSHKALFNTWQALRPGGRIIFLAEAPEGFGGNRFEEWLRLGSPEKVIRQLRKNAEINGQTALSTLEKAPSAWIITCLPEDAVRLTGARKAASLQAGINAAAASLRAQGCAMPTCLLMPAASWTVPFFRDNNSATRSDAGV